MPDDFKNVFHVHPLIVDHYLQEKVYARVDQSGHQKNPPHNVDESHYGALAESLCNYNCVHPRGMMKVYFLSSVKPEGATYATIVHAADGTKLLKEDNLMVMLDGRHHRLPGKIVKR